MHICYVYCLPLFLQQFEVTLKKNPTLGLGITGGKDGENALRPGDKVRHMK